MVKIMPLIKTDMQRVYTAPTKGRRYLTARAAANAEANAMMVGKYPTEQPEYEDGRMYDPGYHWTTDERLIRVHKRLARMLLRQLRKSNEH